MSSPSGVRKRAVGIVRVSQVSGRTGESFASPTEQRLRIEAACERDGLALVDIHDELDVSGGAILARRPGLSRAVAAVEAGEADVVAAAYFDRLFRSLTTQAEVVDRVERAGGRVLAVDVGEITNGSAGQWLSGTMLGAVSEYYRRSAKDRGNQTADSVVARGVHNRVPFGYRRNANPDGSKANPALDGKALVPDPETAPLVRRIFELRVDGHAWTGIGDWLHAEGVRPPRGGHWSVSTIRNMIGNDVYLGVVTLGPRRVEGAHEPLVSAGLWRAAQSSTRIQRTGRNAAGVAGGLLRCASCGRTLTVTGTNPAYTCRRRSGGKPCERPVYVSKHRADDYVERVIVEVLEQGTLEVVTSSGDLERLRADLAEAEAELEAYVETAAALDTRLFTRGLHARQERVTAARSSLDETSARADLATDLPQASGWAALDIDGRRRVARALIADVIVSPPASIADRGPRADVDKRFSIRWNGAG